ncbi:MAG TPA: hypothetical protein VGB63_12010 [Pedobacter sp.]|jgi:hypothetical protein
MQSEELLLNKLKTAVELQLGWGDGHTWSNQDFIELSAQVFLKTKVNLSTSTLKRVWGRVNYSSTPSTTTLDTLSRFSGFDSWRDFKLKSSSNTRDPADQQAKSNFKKYAIIACSIMLTITIAIFLSWKLKKPELNPNDYQFSSKTVVTAGVPNSVIFDFDASSAPVDSVIIQQSWNQELQTKVSKNQKHHTSIYYYPNHFLAKLIVGDQIIKEHGLLIRSNGWLPLIDQKPAPIYLNLRDVRKRGKLNITATDVISKNVSLSPDPPTVMFTNVSDFGEIYTNNFLFEASVKNTYAEGAGACQTSSIFLYCIGSVIKIPLSTKGCVSDANIMFTDFYADGKKENLSAFGVDFTEFVKVRIESVKGKAKIFINDRLAYSVNEGLKKAKIVGMSCRFKGAGAVDFVRLSNGKHEFKDEF